MVSKNLLAITIILSKTDRVDPRVHLELRACGGYPIESAILRRTVWTAVLTYLSGSRIVGFNVVRHPWFLNGTAIALKSELKGEIFSTRCREKKKFDGFKTNLHRNLKNL